MTATATADTETDESSADAEERPDELPLPGNVSSSEEAGLDRDTAFELLKNWRRREVLRCLADHEQLELGELAERVAATENDVSRAELTSKQRKRVYVALYQCHLPMMDRAGVVAFNRARGIVEARPLTRQLRDYLDEPGVQSSWSVYLVLGVLGGVTYVSGALTLHPGPWYGALVVFLQLLAVGALTAALRRDDLPGPADLLAALRAEDPEDPPAGQSADD